MPPTNPSTADIDDEWSDVEGGDDAPMTPTDMPGDEMDVEYAPTSVGSNDGSRDAAMHIETVHGRRKQSMREAAEGNEDIAPVLQLCGAAMSAAQQIHVANASILNLVRELGGDSRRYVG